MIILIGSIQRLSPFGIVLPFHNTEISCVISLKEWKKKKINLKESFELWSLRKTIRRKINEKGVLVKGILMETEKVTGSNL